MSAKTIFLIIVSVLVTVILMNNTDEVTFWIFGDASVPKLAVLGTMFGLGLIVGYLLGRPRKKVAEALKANPELSKEDKDQNTEDRNYLSDDDREYIR